MVLILLVFYAQQANDDLINLCTFYMGSFGRFGASSTNLSYGPGQVKQLVGNSL